MHACALPATNDVLPLVLKLHREKPGSWALDLPNKPVLQGLSSWLLLRKAAKPRGLQRNAPSCSAPRCCNAVVMGLRLWARTLHAAGLTCYCRSR
jgi:hypothetical protein